MPLGSLSSLLEHETNQIEAERTTLSSLIPAVGPSRSVAALPLPASPRRAKKMDHQHQQQQYGEAYRALVPSPQPDHLHALQYHNQPQQQPPASTPPPPHHHASLASHFHLLHLVTRLADAIGTGTRDPNFDALVEEMTSQFSRCQQLLNSISGTISSKSTTVEGQRQSLEETRQLLDQRKDLITKYRSSVEDLIKGDTR